MRYYPVFLDLKGRKCLVVGGGSVAERKALALLAAGAAVSVVSPKATRALQGLARDGKIALEKRPYRTGDARGRFLVVAAAGSSRVNEAAWQDAEAEKALVNVVDDPERCSFIVPSIVDRGSLVIAISTSGKSPYLARLLREELEECIGAEYEAFVEILGAARKKLLKSGLSHDKKERIIKDLVKSPIPALLREGRAREASSVLKRTLGCTISGLGLDKKGKARR